MIAPMIGPSKVPSPPTSTMKSMKAVHCTPNTDVGLDEERVGEVERAGDAAAHGGDDEERLVWSAPR